MSVDRARAATIFDVARLAGVSHQTVSRVVNDLPNVRPSTRQRVELAIQQLRYVPSPAARALVTRRTRTVGAIVGGAPDYGPASTMLAFNEAAREARYAVSMADLVETDRASVREAADRMLRQNVDAIVLIAERVGAFDALQGVELGVPILAVDSRGQSGLPSVSIDQYQGARLAVQHLVALGHTRILHLAGPEDSTDASERVRGWHDVLVENGLITLTPFIGDWSPNSGFQAGDELAKTGEFTAVFAANDQMALGLMHKLSSLGLGVPIDVSIVGFDDQPEAEHFSPPLTTVRPDFSQLGREIVRVLLELMRGERVLERPRAVPELKIRESTASLSAGHGLR